MQRNAKWVLFGALFAIVALTGVWLVRCSLAPTDLSTYELRRDLLVHGNPQLREVAITFDDGPYGTSTEKILNVLKAERARATFFVIGKHIAARPHLIRRM